MVFGLGAAPILPSAVFWSWVGVRANNPVMGDLIFEIAISTGFTICWFIGIGSLFLAWMGRTYGAIARFTCFALCGTLTFSMPLAGAMIDFATAPPAGAVDGFLLVLASAIAGLVLAPLGVFGGWLVWRIAVRPAAIPLEEVAEVF
jgi:hypothetical protein